MENIGAYGEYRVLACLLEQDFEAYQAIRKNQTGYDITVVLNKNKVVRIQVKSTILNNKSTNNSIDIDEGFDFLVIVIYCGKNNTSFYIMSRCEAVSYKGNNKKLGLIRKEGEKHIVKDCIKQNKDKWCKIRSQ